MRVPLLNVFSHAARKRLRYTLLFFLLALLIAGVLGFGAMVLYASNLSAKINRAGVVIQYGNGKVINRCVEFGAEEISGLDLLERTGLDLSVDASNAVGVAVCKIGRDGCNFPNQPCFCECQGASCVYWAYWHLKNGGWDYSNLGASNSTIRNGEVDGWVWGAGTTSSASSPPHTSFDQVCAVDAATATPTKTAVPPTQTEPPATATTIPPTETWTPTQTLAPPTETALPTATEIPPTKTLPPPRKIPNPNNAPSPTIAELASTETSIPSTAALWQASLTPRRHLTATRVPRTPTRATLAQAKSANATRAAEESQLPNEQATLTPRWVSAVALAGGIFVGGVGLVVLVGGAAWYLFKRRGF